MTKLKQGEVPPQSASEHKERSLESAWVITGHPERRAGEAPEIERQRLLALQKRLLSCVGEGAVLRIQIGRGRGGRPVWKIGAQGGEGRAVRAEATAALEKVFLSATSDIKQRQERTDSGVGSGRVYTLRARSVPVVCPAEIGFLADNGLAAPEVSLPVGICVGDGAADLGPLLDPALGILGLELLVTRWCAPLDWAGTAGRLRRLMAKGVDPVAAAVLGQRLGALEQATAWTVECRLELERESALSGWGSMLGRVLLGCDAELVELDAKAPGTEPALGHIVPGGSLPLLLPLREHWELATRKAGGGRTRSRQAPGGIEIGTVGRKRIRLPEDGRSRHTYIVGATGTGKSTMLANMMRQDLEAGEGVILLDPHGELIGDVLSMVPEHRKQDVVLLDPLAEGEVPGFNPLEVGDGPMAELRRGFVIGEFSHLLAGLFDMRECGGPLFQSYFRNTLKLLMTAKVAVRPTLSDFAKVLVDADYRRGLLDVCPDEAVVLFWRKQAERAGGDASLANVAPYIICKLEGFTSSGFLRKVVTQSPGRLNLRRIMDRKGILLVNLDKGLLGMEDSKLLGALLLTEIFACALERGRVPKAERTPVRLYVDEFQNFVSDSVAGMLSEMRKFGVCMTLANQTLSQLEANPGQQNVLHAVLGNVGNLIAFRLGVPDAERLKAFAEPYTSSELQRLPNYHAFARLLGAQGPLEPMLVKGLKPPVGTGCGGRASSSLSVADCFQKDTWPLTAAQGSPEPARCQGP